MSEQPAADKPVIKCPFCPVCGSPPMFIALGLHQTWCMNEDCNVFMWVPWDTAAQNLADQSTIDFPDLEQEPPAGD